MMLSKVQMLLLFLMLLNYASVLEIQVMSFVVEHIQYFNKHYIDVIELHVIF